MSRAGLRFWSAVLAFAVFMVDVLTPLEGAVAVLYVVAILLAARTNRRNDIIVAAAGCITLTISAYLVSHDLQTVASPALRALVSLAAIGITTLLVLQNHTATTRLAAQARLLNLSHDMIFVRDRGGVITFWNKTAEQTYGWAVDEALGQLADELLRTSYSDRREVIETSLLDTGQRTKAGSILAVDARWALQHDHLGKPVAVLETHTALVARELAKDDVALAVETEPDLPPVRGDRIQLQQVLINLLINAGQAMSGRPGSRTIALRASIANGETLGVTVQDSGPGIHPDDLPRLFDPFFTTKDGGMGMGLAICRTTVEAHGGRLSVASTPGSGATFHLTLPYSRAHALS